MAREEQVTLVGVIYEKRGRLFSTSLTAPDQFDCAGVRNGTVRIFTVSLCLYSVRVRD